jgi:diketogulonate reductase-like aldo/keto reductase
VRNLILGGAQFGNGYGSIIRVGMISGADLDQIIATAINAECAVCDVAESYQNVIQNLSKSKLKYSMKFINKIHFKESQLNLRKKLEESLTLLGSSHYEAVLIHDWASLGKDDQKNALTFLEKLKSSGLTKKIGVSVYDTSELVSEMLALDIIQAPLNFYKRDFISDNMAKMLSSNGVEFHARSIFNQGVLLNVDQLTLTQFPELKDFDIFCQELNFDHLAGALSVFDNQDVFTSLVVGVSDSTKLQNIIDCPIATIPEGVFDWNHIYAGAISDPRKWSN